MSIIAHEVHQMVEHWLLTPAGHYLGSSYGNPIKDVLQLTLNDGMADSVLNKLREDIPIIRGMPSNQVNLYAENNGIDTVKIYIEIGGIVQEVRSAN